MMRTCRRCPCRRIGSRKIAPGRRWMTSSPTRCERPMLMRERSVPRATGGTAVSGARVRWMLALTIVALEFSWAYPWVLLRSGMFYGSSAAPLLSAGAALSLLALGHVVVRVVLAREWSLRAARAAVVCAGVGSGMTVIKL